MAEEKVVQSVIQGLENTIDQKLEILGDLDHIRNERYKAMKKRASDEQEWKANGHGEYTEIADEGGFFELIKKSEKVVLHFYVKSTERCKIVDMHMKRIAPQLLGTKFAKIDAEKAPFLTERLKIKVIPTIIGIIDKIIVDRLVGFTELGNSDDFTSNDLKARLSLNGVVDYHPASDSPSTRRKMKIEMELASRRKQNLRDSDSSGTDDDDYEEPQLVEMFDKTALAGNPMNSKDFELTEEEEKLLFGPNEEN